MGCQREVGSGRVRLLLPCHLIRGLFFTASDKIAAARVSGLFTHPSTLLYVTGGDGGDHINQAPLTSTFPWGVAHGSAGRRLKGEERASP